MNKIYREGVKIGIAFSSARRSAAVYLASVESPVTQESVLDAQPVEAGDAVQAPTTRPIVRRFVMRVLRVVAKTIYRAFKPVIRPIAFRSRRYLVEALRTDILHAVDHSIRTFGAEIQASQHALIDRLNAHQQETHLAFLKMKADVVHAVICEIQTGQQTLTKKIRTGLDNTQQVLVKMQADSVDADSREIHALHRAMDDRSRNAYEAMQRALLQIQAELISSLQEGLLKMEAGLADDSRVSNLRFSAEMVNFVAPVMESLLATQAASVLEKMELALSSQFGSLQQFVREDPRLNRIEQYALTTARRAAVSCGPGELLIRTEVGYVVCDATDHALVAILLETGELELGTRLLITRLLKPDDVYVDVGANIGMHTIAAGRAMHFRGKIFAFEPFEKTSRLLAKTVWINGLAGITEIHQSAVADKAGLMDLHLGSTCGHHSLFPIDLPPADGARAVKVEVVTLDSTLPAGQKVDLLKIDVEGAELEVLAGAVGTITRNKDIAVIAEYGPLHLHRTGHSTSQWLKTFADLGLHYMAINEQTGAVEDWLMERIELVDSVNFLFARKDSVVWTRALEGSPA